MIKVITIRAEEIAAYPDETSTICKCEFDSRDFSFASEQEETAPLKKTVIEYRIYPITINGEDIYYASGDRCTSEIMTAIRESMTDMAENNRRMQREWLAKDNDLRKRINECLNLNLRIAKIGRANFWRRLVYLFTRRLP